MKIHRLVSRVKETASYRQELLKLPLKERAMLMFQNMSSLSESDKMQELIFQTKGKANFFGFKPGDENTQDVKDALRDFKKYKSPFK